MIKFYGFLKLYPDKIIQTQLPDCRGDILKLIKLFKTQHFTEPPARYSEASLIKALEERDRSSVTYAPTISTVQDRDMQKGERTAEAPKSGFIVNDL